MAFYGTSRVFFYAFAWVSAVILLGLTAFRIHWTRHNLHDHDPIIAELLTTACLTILFAPVAMFAAIAARGASIVSIATEITLNGIIWVMLLVGAAISTNKWPSNKICEADVTPNTALGSFVVPKQCHILLTIDAFAWVTFIALSFAGVLGLMQWAAERASPAAVTTEKQAPAASQTPATV